MKRITFDIETEGSFSGQPDLSNLEVTVVGVHDSETDQYTSFLKTELSLLWPLLESADMIVGYNSEHFDIPILNKYYTGNLSHIPHIDLLKEVKKVLGRRLRLDNIAEATLGKKKTGHGLQAVQWWKQGEVEKVREYCLNDVKITKDIYEYAKLNNALKYRDFDGMREIKLDTSSWEQFTSASPALTYTLPF